MRAPRDFFAKRCAARTPALFAIAHRSKSPPTFPPLKFQKGSPWRHRPDSGGAGLQGQFKAPRVEGPRYSHGHPRKALRGSLARGGAMARLFARVDWAWNELRRFRQSALDVSELFE